MPRICSSNPFLMRLRLYGEKGFSPFYFWVSWDFLFGVGTTGVFGPKTGRKVAGGLFNVLFFYIDIPILMIFDINS